MPAKEYMSDIVPDDMKIRSKKLAENHVDWLLSMIRPFMIEEFKHGYRHGYEDRENICCIDEDDFI